MRAFLNFLSGAILGAIVGASLALLLTPESGDQLRTDLRDRATHFQDEIKHAAEARRAELEQQLAELRAPRKPHSA